MAFAISSLVLRRGTLALCALPTSTAERAALAAFGPDLVVSMTRRHEMAALGAQDLPDWLHAHHIPWRAFPVEDFGIPPEDADWAGLSAAATELLDNGGTMLLHCRGGLGRSGMVALRLMIEAGEAPEAALARLRAARPGTVETEAQMGWARQGIRA